MHKKKPDHQHLRYSLRMYFNPPKVSIGNEMGRGINLPLPFLFYLLIFTTFSYIGPLWADAVNLADRKNLVFDHIVTTDGLSHPNTSAIFQDKEGYIWIGTVEGLNRYDGYHIETFFHQEDDPASISHDNVWALSEDSNGYLWVATDSGLNRYDSLTGRFQVFYPDGSTRSELSAYHNTVRLMLQDKGGRFWVGTELGLCELLPDGTFAHYHHSPQVPDSISPGAVRAILEDSEGRLWVGTTRGGLNLFDRETGKAVRYRHNSYNSSSLGGNYVRALAEDPDGNIWVGTDAGGVSILQPETGMFQRLKAGPEDSSRLTSNQVRSILVDHKGDVWVATADGLNLWQTDSASFRTFQNDPALRTSLVNNDMLAMFQDRGGVIWAGTNGGVSKWNARVPSFPHIKKDPLKGFDLPDNNVTSFAQDKSGNIWISTNQGLGRWNVADGSITGFAADKLGIKSRLMTLGIDSGDNLWVGTRRDGIHVYDNGQKVAQYRDAFADPIDTRVFGITSIFRDSQGRMWVTTYRGGVFLHLGDGSFRHYQTGGNGRAIDLVEGNNGTLWLALDGGGVEIVDPETGEVRAFRHERGRSDSLSSDKAISALRTSDAIWIGTRDRGLNRIDLTTQEITRYGKSKGLASDVIYGLLEDDDGKIWISGGKGLSVLDVSSGLVTRYDADHGLQGDDFNSGTTLKLEDGSLLFGGTNGFNAFNPLVDRENKHQPEVRITRVTKFNQSSKSPIDVASRDLLELQYDDYVVGFEFVAFDYSAPEKNRYQYILEGFDQGWVDSGDVRQVTYTNLNPGKYVFKVKGTNNDGVWNSTAAELKVVVHPPIWATWWAYGLYIVTIILILYRLQQSNVRRTRMDAERRYNQRLQLYIQSLEEASDCVLIADETKKLLYANTAIRNVLGIEPSMALGRPLVDLLFSRRDEVDVALSGLELQGRWEGEINQIKNDEQFIADVSLSSVKDARNQIIAYVGILRDITERKRAESELANNRRNLEYLVEERTSALSREIADHKEAQQELARSLEEKEMLLKEVHHRVKNNMQVISSLLNIQAETIGSDFFSGLLAESQQRIKSMSLIHENLYQSDNLLEIDFEDYINILASRLSRFYDVPNVSVRMDIRVDNVKLDIGTAVPCGLIINELISNSLKHAFKGSVEEGVISVRFYRDGCSYRLIISDNGVGLPKDLDIGNSASMGMEIVSILTRQLEGNLTYGESEGARFEISFPIVEKEAA